MGLFCIRCSGFLNPHHAGLCGDCCIRSNGPRAHFCFLGLCFCKNYEAARVKMASKQEILEQLVEPVAVSLGCELWGLEYLTQGRYTTVRIYIDGPNGASLEDCERVSRQVSAVFDVEDPIDNEYTLEVSSPGLDRPLYKESQYARFVGEVINVRLRIARDGRRRFKGVINRVENREVFLQVDNQEVQLPLDVIDKANVEPRYDEILRQHNLHADKN